jgi:hypothetical protein
MGFLLKIAIFAVVAYGIWKTAKKWYGILGGTADQAPTRKPDAPPKRGTPPAPSASRPVIEETRLCSICASYVSLGAAKCGRADCPQAA